MYNIDFQVKYHDIEEELLKKLKNNTPEDQEENKEFEYSTQDVLDICDKIYRDELLSVFEAECITDNNINENITYAINILMQNEEIKTQLYELINSFLHENEENGNENRDEKKDYDYESKKKYVESTVFISLFSQEIFYITHQCICQQSRFGSIDNHLLVKLNEFIENN
jgi:hypothetical protein